MVPIKQHEPLAAARPRPSTVLMQPPQHAKKCCDTRRDTQLMVLAARFSIYLSIYGVSMAPRARTWKGVSFWICDIERVAGSSVQKVGRKGLDPCACRRFVAKTKI